MSMIKVLDGNYNNLEIKGRVSFRTEKVETENGQVEYITRGRMTTHYYIEEIKEIETHRYCLRDIDVYAEEYGSDDFDILYEFLVGEFEVKGNHTNLPKEIIESIEKKEYENDDSNQWEKE